MIKDQILRHKEKISMEQACNGTPMIITVSNKSDITSPNYPSKYENNLNCTWKIEANPGRRIELAIQKLQTEGEIEKKYVITDLSA